MRNEFSSFMNLSRPKKVEGKEQRRKLKMSKAKLIYCIGIQQKKELACTSEVGWISKSSLLITIDNKYFYINLD